MEDPMSFVFPEQSTDSLSSVLAMIQGHDPRPHQSAQPTDSSSSVQAMIEGNHYPPNQTHLNSAQSPTKQLRYSPVFDAPDKDLISSLPDSLLQEILCFLPIEDAIKTCFLSRRWRSLWTQMPTLLFTREYFAVKHAKRAEFVNETLRRFTGPKIKNFLINFKFDDSMDASLEEWVLFATTHHVEKLSLIFDGGFLYAPFADSKPYSLPQFLYLSSSLKDLILRQWVVSPTDQVSWPSLKVLSINYSRLTTEAIENILSGSPNLQKLKLHNCGGVNRICSTNLEVLEVDAVYEPHEKNESVTEISCPNLQSLSLSGYMYKRTFRVMHVSSLSNANLSFVMTIDKEDKYDCSKHRSILRDLLEKLCHVEKLTVLSIWEIKGISSPLSKRHCLVLDTEICEWDIPGIVSLLQSSPYLKKLVINLYYCDNSKFEFDQSFFDFYEFDGEEFLDSTNWIFKCFLQSLEDIELTGFQQNSSGSQFLAKFMKFLLNSGKVVKKVAIYEHSGGLHKSWKFSRPKMYTELENAKKNQIILTLSSCIPSNVVSD
ncbi:Riboflavin kinase/FMN hydrolase [Hibiscus syriacus]|uniref:Riboflavin kinase/FMN hydrolase n=1 Tax=Hibiscus syriacus TaxID=106335 RepID=A0A6A2WJU6_HIBSY|nr:Riboflavin kinase/FMN hydrolase [Hibiscus syriacus]